MSYQSVKDGLQERLETLPGIVDVLQYEPSSFGDTPLAYLLFDHSEDATQGQVVGTRYFVTIRLVVQWTDNEGAELEIDPYIDSIPAAIQADRQLGGRIRRGMATKPGGEGGFIDVGAVRYRIVDFVTEVLDKPVT
jgi:hypothetical protein